MISFWYTKENTQTTKLKICSRLKNTVFALSIEENLQLYALRVRWFLSE